MASCVVRRVDGVHDLPNGDVMSTWTNQAEGIYTLEEEWGRVVAHYAEEHQAKVRSVKRLTYQPGCSNFDRRKDLHDIQRVGGPNFA